MIAVICAVLGFAIILTVAAVAVLGWAGRLTRLERVGLCVLAAGLVWAGPGRFLSTPGPGLGDLLFLAGIGTLLVSIYGRALIAHIEGMDGRQDGRLWPFS